MHSFFQVINEESSTWLRLVKGEDGPVNIGEVMEYLNLHQIPFDVKELNRNIQETESERKMMLCAQKSFPIREEFHLSTTGDKMEATARFYPASNDGLVLDRAGILDELRRQKVVFGIQEGVIDDYLERRAYCENFIIALGKPPRHGKDAYVEYLFNTDLKAKPTLKEDGSVDFFNLNIINHCQEGDCLARLHPEDPEKRDRMYAVM